MCSKQCLSYKQARAIINDAKKNNHRNHMKKIPVREYWCEHCQAYHTTSSKSWHGGENGQD